MSVYIYQPPHCMACECEVLLKRQFRIASRAIVRYRCPKCSWIVEGRDPEIPSTPSVVLLDALQPNVAEELDEPMRRHYGSPDRVPLPYPVFGEPRDVTQ